MPSDIYSSTCKRTTFRLDNIDFFKFAHCAQLWRHSKLTTGVEWLCLCSAVQINSIEELDKETTHTKEIHHICYIRL